jgi:hypothetical protein
VAPAIRQTAVFVDWEEVKQSTCHQADKAERAEIRIFIGFGAGLRKDQARSTPIKFEQKLNTCPNIVRRTRIGRTANLECETRRDGGRPDV